MYFATYCHKSLGLRAETIKLYLAGIRFNYLKAGFPNVLAQADKLHYIINGIKKSQQNRSLKRLPITYDLLHELCQLLKTGVFSPYTDKLLTAMFTMAFFGFLRCGEITVKQNCRNGIQLCDLEMDPNHTQYTLLLRASKTDPFRHGVTVKIYRNLKLCAVEAMVQYLYARYRHVDTSESLLFVDYNYAPITRCQFIAYLRHLLSRLGRHELSYCGHSFRIGAATTAAAEGVEDHMIQTLGRWSSNCYTTYIRTSPHVIRKAQNQMCGQL